MVLFILCFLFENIVFCSIVARWSLAKARQLSLLSLRFSEEKCSVALDGEEQLETGGRGEVFFFFFLGGVYMFLKKNKKNVVVFFV